MSISQSMGLIGELSSHKNTDGERLQFRSCEAVPESAVHIWLPTRTLLTIIQSINLEEENEDANVQGIPLKSGSTPDVSDC